MPIQINVPDIRVIEGGVSQFMLADNSVGSAEIQTGAVGAETLANLPIPADLTIQATDTILEAFAKLQGQINAIRG